MELNVLNKKLNVNPNEYHDKSEQEFWYIYCQLLNIRKPILSDKDCEILSAILTMTPNEFSILEKDNGKLLEQVTKTPLSNLYAKCKQLAEKGFLEKTDNGYFINPAFIKFQEYIKAGNGKEVKFVLPIKIINNGIIDI